MSRRTRLRKTAVRVQDSTVMHGFARAGFAVNGILHVIMGVITFAVAFGEKGLANQDGALAQLSAGPIGGLLLWAAVAGLVGLALFQVLTLAIIRGTSKAAWLARSKPFGRAIGYLGLAFIAFRFALGGSTDSSEARDVSADLMARPGGILVVAAAGLTILIVGVVFVVIGFRGRYLDDLDTERPVVNGTARVIGGIGYIAKGISFAAIGVLLLIAAYQAEPKQAVGLDGALESLRRLPSGNVVLSAVALGFILFGLYCLIRTKYERLELPKWRLRR
jgi:hypothetical protein